MKYSERSTHLFLILQDVSGHFGDLGKTDIPVVLGHIVTIFKTNILTVSYFIILKYNFIIQSIQAVKLSWLFS